MNNILEFRMRYRREGAEIYLRYLAASEIKKEIWNARRNSTGMTLEKDAIALHRILKGKIGIQSRVTANFGRALSITGTVGENAQGINETNNESRKFHNYG